MHFVGPVVIDSHMVVVVHADRTRCPRRALLPSEVSALDAGATRADEVPSRSSQGRSLGG